MAVTVDLTLLEGAYAVTLLPPDSAVPGWVGNAGIGAGTGSRTDTGAGFVNISYCADELSIVTPADRVPDGIETDGGKTDKGWRALKLTGSFDFDEPGIVLSVVRPISEAGLAVFVVSTFHRDYLLVRSDSLEKIRALLQEAGHRWV